MIRYLIFLFVFLAGLVSSILLTGIPLMALVDIPSFFFVGVFPFLLVSVLFGFKEMKATYRTALRKEPDIDCISKAQGFFNAFGAAIWIMGMIGTLNGIVGTLRNLDDKDSIGPNMALAVVSIFYSVILYFTAVLPFTLLLKKKRKAQSAEEDRRVS